MSSKGIGVNIETKDIETFDRRIEIDDCWITVRDGAGSVLLHECPEWNGWPVISRGIVASIEPLWYWMDEHLHGVLGEHKALLVAVSPDMTDAEYRMIRACLSVFFPLRIGFIQLPVAAQGVCARNGRG